MNGWFSPLLYLLASSSESDLHRHLEFLKVENEMLRRRVPKKRIFLDDDERERLLKLGEAIGSGVSKLITIVHSRTYQRWLRKKRLGQKLAKKLGRTKTLESVREIVLRIARETGWGYGRIVGELRKLRIHCVGRTTVRTILKEKGVQPSPKRGKGTWDEFIKIHAETLWQVDFFSKMVVTKTGLTQAFVLAFLHVESRRVICSPATFKPEDKWMVKQAEAMLCQARETGLPIGQLIRDRDNCYTCNFNTVFKQADVRVIPTAPRAPNQNGYVERWIGSLRYECLNRFITFGLSHLDHIVLEYVEFYNELRPHQSLDNRPLQGEWSILDDPPDDQEQVVCQKRLGGVLKHYERLAA
jgi:putative transposase